MANVSATWDARLRSALAKDYDGLRVASNVDWLGPRDWEVFVGDEPLDTESGDTHPAVVAGLGEQIE